jgi:hypothetical protein
MVQGKEKKKTKSLTDRHQRGCLGHRTVATWRSKVGWRSKRKVSKIPVPSTFGPLVKSWVFDGFYHHHRPSMRVTWQVSDVGGRAEGEIGEKAEGGGRKKWISREAAIGFVIFHLAPLHLSSCLSIPCKIHAKFVGLKRNHTRNCSTRNDCSSDVGN